MSPRREVTDRLPDPEIVREGRIGINNAEAENLPEKYLDVVEDVLPLRREREGEK